MQGFRSLPSVDRLISDERLKSLEGVYWRPLILSAVREQLGQSRLSIAQGGITPSFDELIESICARIQSLAQPSLYPVINATGVILHTNLGRACLSKETIAAMELASKSYLNLEFDLDSGKRGSRQVHIESLLCQLTGAEAALVVNNNAAGVLLALAALAKGKEVILSRGQAVEIGGGFRLPEVMRQSGAKLVDVGTTNCTYVSDYKQAITPKTAALLRVHSSNFKILGFTEVVTLPELVQLGQEYNLPVLDDLGSGCLLDTTEFGLDPEPRVQDSIAAGAGLALFSGDKLMGGPQAGIIVGEKHLVDRLKKHPLARAARIDKVRLAGVAITLLHYLKGEAKTKIPVWQMLSTPLQEIEKRAQEWSRCFGNLATVVEGESMVGGGSLPGNTLPTRLVAIQGKGRNMVQELARELRAQQPPIVGRIHGNSLLLDPRTVPPEEDEVILKVLRDASKAVSVG